MAEAGGEQMTPEELVEQFRQMKASDLLLSTLFTLSQLAYGKLEPSARDLEQARIAIDAMGVLMPVVEPVFPAETVRDFNQVITNLRLAYAAAASEPAEPRGQAPGQGGEGHVGGTVPGTGPEETSAGDG